MKTITTIHTEIGYSNNIDIISAALRRHFGFDYNSHVQTAVAAHVWSQVCVMGEEKRWGTKEVQQALAGIRGRLDILDIALAETERAHASDALDYRTDEEGRARAATAGA